MFKGKARSYFIIAIGFSLVVTFLLFTPGTEFPKITWKDKIFLDKWIHAALFAILVMSWCRVYSKTTITTRKNFIAVAALVFLYGIGTEIFQEYFVPFRSFEIPDIFADAAGSIIGYFISARKYLPNKL